MYQPGNVFDLSPPENRRIISAEGGKYPFRLRLADIIIQPSLERGKMILLAKNNQRKVA